MLPLRLVGKGGSLAAHGIALLLVGIEHGFDGGGNAVGNVEIIIIRTVQHGHAVGERAFTAEHLIYPLAETRKIGRDAGRLEGAGFERRVTPRLVVGRIYGKVVGRKQVVVRQVEDAVIAFEVARHKHSLHLAALFVRQSERLHRAKYAVLVEVVKVVRNDGQIERLCCLFLRGKAFLQVLARTEEPARYFHQGDNIAFVVSRLQVSFKTHQRFEIYVEAFATVVVAPACRYNQGVFCERLAGKGGHNINNTRARETACLCKGCANGHKVILKTIRQHHVCRLIEQLLALAVGESAHGGEAIRAVRAALFYAVLGLHVQLACHLVAVIAGEPFIKFLVVACYGTADARGVGGENGRHFGTMLL